MTLLRNSSLKSMTPVKTLFTGVKNTVKFWCPSVNGIDNICQKSDLSDTEPIRFQTYQIPNLSDYQTYQIPNFQISNLSDTEPARYQIYQIPNLSDAKPISFRSYQILYLSDNEPTTYWAVSPSPFKSLDDRQPLLAWPMAKLGGRKKVHSSSLSHGDEVQYLISSVCIW